MGMSNLKGSTKTGGGRTITRHHEVKKTFLIDLEEYGGTIEIAKEKIRVICKESLFKEDCYEAVKVKIKPYNDKLLQLRNNLL